MEITEVVDEKPQMFDLDNISGTEFLQQMYYMIEGRAMKMGDSADTCGTVIAFDGIAGEQLYMLSFPFVPSEEVEDPIT
jgi:hypothetical protein